jgi:hypothetical protein
MWRVSWLVVMQAVLVVLHAVWCEEVVVVTLTCFT